ncbi:hypothetical protein LINPERHAP1_LOCUS10007 [Linum perenne]
MALSSSSLLQTATCPAPFTVAKLARITQGDLTVTAYFNALKRIWLDLDTFHDYEWESTRDANYYRSMVNKDQVFKFLSGLNDDLDEVRGRIIAQKPLPKLGEAFSEVRREETRRRLMLENKSAPLVAEGSALQVATQTYPRYVLEAQSRKEVFQKQGAFEGQQCQQQRIFH